jgi:hypothetical protein
MEKQSFLSQLLARLTSETPIFFKKIVLFGITLGGIGLAILAINVTKIPVSIPPIVFTIAGYFVAIGAVCTAVAKATTTSPNLQAQGGSNVIVNQETAPIGESKVAAQSPPIQ